MLSAKYTQYMADTAAEVAENAESAPTDATHLHGKLNDMKDMVRLVHRRLDTLEEAMAHLLDRLG